MRRKTRILLPLPCIFYYFCVLLYLVNIIRLKENIKKLTVNLTNDKSSKSCFFLNQAYLITCWCRNCENLHTLFDAAAHTIFWCCTAAVGCQCCCCLVVAACCGDRSHFYFWSLGSFACECWQKRKGNLSSSFGSGWVLLLRLTFFNSFSSSAKWTLAS